MALRLRGIREENTPRATSCESHVTRRKQQQIHRMFSKEVSIPFLEYFYFAHDRLIANPVFCNVRQGGKSCITEISASSLERKRDDDDKPRRERGRWMRPAPQKESRLETEEELEEVREVIRRASEEEWERERERERKREREREREREQRDAGKGLLRRRSLARSLARSLLRSSPSQSYKAKTDVEMRSLKGGRAD